MLIIYGEFLLLSQYVYGMNLRADELPNEDYMKIIGFVRAETRTQAFVTLAIKVSNLLVYRGVGRLGVCSSLSVQGRLF